MRERTDTLLTDTRGLTTVEYIIIVSLIAVVGFTAWQSFGATVSRKVGMSSDAIAAINPVGAGSGAGAGPADGTGSGTSALTGLDSPADADGTGAGAFGDPVAGGEGGEDMWGDGALGRGDATGAEAVARGVVDGAADVITGTVDGALALAGGIWDAVTHPADTAAAVAHAVTNPRETARAALDATKAIVGGAIDAGSAMIDACTSGDSYGCTRGATNVIASIIPVGAAGNVVRGAGAVRNGTNLANRAGAAARRRTRDDPDRFGWAHATPESLDAYAAAPVGQRFYGLIDTKTGAVHFRPSEIVRENRANLPAGASGHMSLGQMVGLRRGEEALGFSVRKTADGPTATYRSSYNMAHPDFELNASDVEMRQRPSRHVERALRQAREEGQNVPIGRTASGW